ncbi:MAG: hypothetical protein OFPI_08340 [Osedax symbiont Rs2]|nr:MAG: hypothetical protein OFPII_09100 [Osedax symbiont Rs1]EPJ53998.1 MAG: hypothetical protein OFPI_08340 [Osedax symbiont Rs2]
MTLSLSYLSYILFKKHQLYLEVQLVFLNFAIKSIDYDF